jgi:iron complex outermembrane recepter protein
LAKMSFDLSHYADGLENYGPDRRSGESRETSFTPKVGLSFQMDPANLFYTTYSKGYRPGGGNAPLPGFCDADLVTTGYPAGAPLTYKSDSTQSFEIGSKNNFNNRVRLATSVYYIKWHDIQQNVYVAGNCGLQFTDNLGEAVSKGFDAQAELVVGGGFSLEAAFGYTSARYTRSTAPPKPLLVNEGDAISGEAAIDYGPGTIAPWTVALGVQYNFAADGREAYLRVDWEYASRNNWLAAIQDPQTEQYNANTYPLPATSHASLRGGVTIGKWVISAFVENLFDSRTVTNYALGPYDPMLPQPSSVQQNAWTFRPRTIGIGASYRL